jgi:hypothetical protein
LLSATALDAGADRQEEFAHADPFAHIVLDGVLAAAPSDLLATFPKPDWAGWRRSVDQYHSANRTCSDLSVLPAVMAGLLGELQSPATLQFLEQLTGIDKLIPDPYLEGGGLHCSSPGESLDPRPDRHTSTRLGLYRRLNVLLSLNDRWTADDGGELELFALGDAVPTRTVVPGWGRMVVLRTDERSVRGFTHPVAPGRCRRSAVLYYYTSAEAAPYGAGPTTPPPERAGPRDPATTRGALSRSLLTGSRRLSSLARRATSAVR